MCADPPGGAPPHLGRDPNPPPQRIGIGGISGRIDNCATGNESRASRRFLVFCGKRIGGSIACDCYLDSGRNGEFTPLRCAFEVEIDRRPPTPNKVGEIRLSPEAKDRFGIIVDSYIISSYRELKGYQFRRIRWSVKG